MPPPPNPGIWLAAAHSAALRARCAGGNVSIVCRSGCPPISQSSVEAFASPRCMCTMHTCCSIRDVGGEVKKEACS